MRTFSIHALLSVFIATPLFTASTFAAGKLPERRSPAIDPAFKTPGLTVPDGYVVELVAGPPLIKHPTMAGFDDRGRLFVAETAGLNLKDSELDQQTPNFMTVLEDTNGDGLFDKSTLFADKMTFPQGALWLNGALYVSSPPGLWKLEDTDGDGKCDRRTQLVTGFAYTGNAADVHGPFLGPTGRLYWCHGRKGHDVHQHDGAIVSKAKGARIWSCKPDGSDIQVFAGGGMDNPVEVDFMPEGDMLGTINLFHGRPRGDTLVHWLHGGVYPRHDQEAVVAEFKHTGDLLPEVFNYGHVAVSGMTRYRSTGLGADFGNNLFITYFNTHKVTRSILTRDGSTYRCRNVDFFSLDSTDVHFTDVFEDADGSLLVIDTGGWFRIGCPTSQIAKPDIYGAIYRIRKAGGDIPADPRGLRIDWKKAATRELIRLLDDERFAVRDRAIATLANQGATAVSSLSEALKKPSARLRLNAVWSLARIGSPKALAALRPALKDKDAGVRQAACHSAAILRDKPAASELMTLIGTDEPPVQREAASALGRIGEERAVPAILKVLEQSVDRQFEHALIFALIEINRPQPVLPALASGNPALQRRALIALDQMNDGQLTAQRVLPLLDARDEALRLAALAVLNRRANWAEDAAALFDQWLGGGRVSEQRLQVLAGALPKLMASERGAAVAGRMLSRWKTDPATCKVALTAIPQASKLKLPESWQKPIEESLACREGDLAADSIGAIAALKTDRFDAQLRQISADGQMPALLRIKAMDAMAARTGALTEGSFDMLVQQMNPKVPSATRAEASHLLSKASLTKPQLLGLTRLVASVGPLELPMLLGAFNQSRDKEVGAALVAVLTNSAAVGTLKPDDVRKLFQRFPAEVRDHAKPMVDDLVAQAEQQTARLLKFDADLPTGDAGRGKEIFYSEKAVCSVCHRVGDKGGQVGPDLTRIGRIRTQRDLLEAILYPSASFARDYEPYNVNTKDGEAQSGVIQRETSDAIYLGNATGTAVKIARDTIQSINASQISTMPQGLENAIPLEQLADLVAFLRSLQ